MPLVNCTLGRGPRSPHPDSGIPGSESQSRPFLAPVCDHPQSRNPCFPAALRPQPKRLAQKCHPVKGLFFLTPRSDAAQPLWPWPCPRRPQAQPSLPAGEVGRRASGRMYRTLKLTPPDAEQKGPKSRRRGCRGGRLTCSLSRGWTAISPRRERGDHAIRAARPLWGAGEGAGGSLKASEGRSGPWRRGGGAPLLDGGRPFPRPHFHVDNRHNSSPPACRAPAVAYHFP